MIRVLREAAISKEVRSIKMTLYRLAKDSKVVKALICAAQNGKKVTVIIELLARFDEASNINWSKRMQDAGIKVIFGVEGLKIHSKLIHIGTRFGDLACISTGNFHEGYARMYTDFTIMTAHRSIVREVNSVFDFIEKPYLPANFKELLVSPNDMRKRLIALITKEIKNKQGGGENFLMAVATVGAIAVALYENGDYTEAIAVMLFYQIGELFQSYAVGKSRKNISELMDIRPDYANIEVDGKLTQVDPDEVAIGSVIVVQPGEKVPIDGVIVEGSSTLNTSALTGESVPRDAKCGDEIISGCINMTGVLKIQTTKEFG